MGEQPRTTCMVVDDHAAIREGVRRILEHEGTMSVVGEASSGESAIEMADRRRPDVIVMDVQMGGIDGFEATRRILAAHAEIGVVLYTAFKERWLLSEGMDCGARGYVLKDAPPEDIVRAIRQVAAGGAYIDPTLAGSMMNARVTDQLPQLSRREREVLSLLADGLRNDEIAERLFISPETVRTHVRNATLKLEADTRTQAVALAVRYSIIE
jgi:DNA-binding NarL/FixJ family response regulator